MFSFKTQVKPWLASTVLFFTLVVPVSAGQFGVSPIRIDLDRSARNGAITVTNDEEADPLRAQLKLFEWTQMSGGKDEYKEVEDLVYFPRLMALEKGEQKVVRVGLRTPAIEREKTYRLFIEELPPPPAAGGARVAIAVRFGVPIFVKPIKEEAKGEIDKIDMVKGVLRIGVRNTGNVHFAIASITAASGTAFSKEASGWYLLAGVDREHTIEVPTAACATLKQIDVTVKTDKLELKKTLDVNAAMCGT